jgi:hypothetical protein
MADLPYIPDTSPRKLISKHIIETSRYASAFIGIIVFCMVSIIELLARLNPP